MKTETKVLWGGVLIAIVIATAALFTGGASAPTELPKAGSSANGGNVTDYTAVNVVAGYWVAGTKVINSSGQWITGIVAATIAQFDAGVLHSYTLSTSTPASLTLAASDVTNYESVIVLPTVGDVTLTLPASSTLSAIVPAAGDWQELCIVNATTTNIGRITIAGGTGTTLQVASSSATALGSKLILPGKTGCIKFFRIGAGNNALDINALLTVFQ